MSVIRALYSAALHQSALTEERLSTHAEGRARGKSTADPDAGGGAELRRDRRALRNGTPPGYSGRLSWRHSCPANSAIVRLSQFFRLCNRLSAWAA